MKTILITGGAGFIGGCFVRREVERGERRIINLDALTYAGNLDSIPDPGPRHVFVKGSIGDKALVSRLLNQYQPTAIINFAAESHVDRSIDGPSPFIQTNVDGTFCLLESALDYWRSLRGAATNELDPQPGVGQDGDGGGDDATNEGFRFLHVSTDEVYGSLGPTGRFTETTPYAPSSPYSASKAASDHLVRAWHHTYGLPTLITNCSNNYGPYQFPEKLIPLMILRAIEGRSLPVYGDGLNVRDWLHVEDHCEALETLLERGVIGETYNVGGDREHTNIEVVQEICAAVQQIRPDLGHNCHDLITFVDDRPGHDRRYAIDASKIKRELGWTPKREFCSSIRETVRWYIENPIWVERVTTGKYRGERLGGSQ